MHLPNETTAFWYMPTAMLLYKTGSSEMPTAKRGHTAKNGTGSLWLC